MLGKRLLTALWGIPLVIAAVWFDKPIPWFTVLAVLAGTLGILEFYRLAGVWKNLPLAVSGVILTLFFVIYPHFDFKLDISVVSLIVVAALAVIIIILAYRPVKEGFLRDAAWALVGVLYIGWLISYLVALRLVPGLADYPETGRNLLFLALFVTFASDTAAYFVGKAIGRHKLAPSISPGKTWEGAVAGLVGAVIVSLLFLPKTPFQLPLSYAFIGIPVSILAQIGDLLESKLKRGFGVKDSGRLMPGHGGILDRLDSILFAGVTVYIYYTIVTAF